MVQCRKASGGTSGKEALVKTFHFNSLVVLFSALFAGLACEPGARRVETQTFPTDSSEQRPISRALQPADGHVAAANGAKIPIRLGEPAEEDESLGPPASQTIVIEPVDPSQQEIEPWRGDVGIRETVDQIVARG